MSGAAAAGRAARCCVCAAAAAVAIRAKTSSGRAYRLSVRRQSIVRASLAPRKRTSVVAKAAASYYENRRPDHAHHAAPLCVKPLAAAMRQNWKITPSPSLYCFHGPKAVKLSPGACLRSMSPKSFANFSFGHTEAKPHSYHNGGRNAPNLGRQLRDGRARVEPDQAQRPVPDRQLERLSSRR